MDLARRRRGAVGRRARQGRLFALGAALLTACLAAAPTVGAEAPQAATSRPASSDNYPREDIYDTAVGPDEALVNVSLTSNRWPDCTTLGSAVRDIFRIEGVSEKSDQDKALGLWKWFRILISSTGGAYAYEGPPGRERIVHDPHKIFTVYGHHQCDGLSWAMVPLWRAAGYMALDECTLGHTTAALRYRDADGVQRYHSFDPQGRFYYWDAVHERVSTRTIPVMTGMVYRHLTAPQRLHSLRTSLRIGEAIERRWQNRGHVVPSGRPGEPVWPRYYAYREGRTDGIYAAVGEQVQTLQAETDPQRFGDQLHAGSGNVTCSPPAEGKATLHPAEAGEPASFVYRLAPPYVIADAAVEATLLKARDQDLCRLSISRDGLPWQTIFEKKKAGAEQVTIELGPPGRGKKRPTAYTAYDLRIRAEFATQGDVRGVGMNRLRATAHRMLNKRTLPNLMPGENHFRVTADRIAPGWVLRLRVDYELNGRAMKSEHTIGRFPYFFRIDAAGVKLRTIRNYDQDFNNEAARMISYRMSLAPASDGAADRGLEGRQVSEKFRRSFPHPADMTRRRVRKTVETDPMQTSGFFPQSRAVSTDRQQMDRLIRQLQRGSVMQKWRAAEELGSHRESVELLCRALPRANLDLTLFIVKALAQIGDRRAVDPLLAKWALGPRYSPGTRYIPDALAEILKRGATGSTPPAEVDPRVVPALIEPLKKVRFDFRLHIAHALGELGGPAAVEALKELAEKDPFPAVREEAAAALEKIRSRSGRKPGAPPARSKPRQAATSALEASSRPGSVKMTRQLPVQTGEK